MIQDIFHGTDVTLLSPPEIEGGLHRAYTLYLQLKETNKEDRLSDGTIVESIDFRRAMPVIKEAVVEKLVSKDVLDTTDLQECYDSALSQLRTAGYYLSDCIRGTEDFPDLYEPAAPFFEKYAEAIEELGYRKACEQAYFDAVGVSIDVAKTPAFDKEYMNILADGGYELYSIQSFYNHLSYDIMDDLKLEADKPLWLPSPVPIYESEDTDVYYRPIDAICLTIDGDLLVHRDGTGEDKWIDVNQALLVDTVDHVPVAPLRGDSDNELLKGAAFREYAFLQACLSSVRSAMTIELSENEKQTLKKENVIEPDMEFLKDAKGCMEYFGQTWSELILSAFEKNSKESSWHFLSPRGQQELFTRKRFPVYDSLILSLMAMNGKGSVYWAEHSELRKRGVETYEPGVLLLSIDMENGGAFSAHRVFRSADIKHDIGVKYREHMARELDIDEEAAYMYGGLDEYYGPRNHAFVEMMNAYKEKFPTAGELELRLAEVVFRQTIGGSIDKRPLSDDVKANLSSRAESAAEVFSCVINTANRAKTVMREQHLEMWLDSELPKEIKEKISEEKKPDNGANPEMVSMDI